MNEEIIFVGSAIAGSLLTIAIDRLVKPAFSKANKNTLASYDSVKTELNSLEFERNLVAESALKVNEAFDENRIDVFERDKLLQRYTSQIEEYDEKVEKYQNLLDFTDLRNQRDNLTDIMNRRISSIDQRLKDIHNKFAITYGSKECSPIEQVVEKAVQEAVHDNLSDSKHINEFAQYSSSASSAQTPSQPFVDDRPEVKQLEDLHHQIMLELDRLEHDDKKIDETSATASNDDLQSSTMIQVGKDTESILGNDRESVNRKKETTSSSSLLEEDQADES